MRLCEPCTSPFVHAEARQCSTRNSVAQKEGQNFSDLALKFLFNWTGHTSPYHVGAGQSGSRIHEERALIRIGIGRVLAWESPAVTSV